MEKEADGSGALQGDMFYKVPNTFSFSPVAGAFVSLLVANAKSTSCVFTPSKRREVSRELVKIRKDKLIIIEIANIKLVTAEQLIRRRKEIVRKQREIFYCLQLGEKKIESEAVNISLFQSQSDWLAMLKQPTFVCRLSAYCR